MNENLEKVKLADRKRQEIARRIKARLDRQRRQELERIRMMNAFAIVSSLGMMTVIDFLLAYWGGHDDCYRFSACILGRRLAR